MLSHHPKRGWRPSQTLRLLLLFLTAGFISLFFLPVIGNNPLHAQREDLFFDPQSPCNDNPNSEECICRNSQPYSYQPKGEHWDKNVSYDSENPHLSLKRNPQQYFLYVDGVWIDKNGPGVAPDLEVNDKLFRKSCSYDYFEENIRRLWYFCVALAAGFVTLSAAWVGVVYMQDAGSAETRSRARILLVRVIMGAILLGLAYVAWEAVTSMLWPNYAGTF